MQPTAVLWLKPDTPGINQCHRSWSGEGPRCFCQNWRMVGDGVVRVGDWSVFKLNVDEFMFYMTFMMASSNN